MNDPMTKHLKIHRDDSELTLERSREIEPMKPVMTRKELAEVLRVSLRTVDRLPIKSALVAPRTRRYLAKHVLEYIERRAQ